MRTELRIGNIISVGEPSKHSDLQLSQKDFENLIVFKTFDRIQPIPITEDWLVKFGFEYDEDLDVFIISFPDGKKLGVRDYTMSNQGFKIVWVWDKVLKHIVNNLEHVHRLQNLVFALTQTELILE